ncbi:hypothetical protein D4764_22G0004160 [Takifugu flavidus]|uniref:Uncharacterized protein n=1 Tax=Takifugu flavidus TaxID=433684 RepID=A0A5C6NDI4_9TELE|nr:hypothetical protein D4764_22G0004160 [Takifugu flavidus]
MAYGLSRNPPPGEVQDAEPRELAKQNIHTQALPKEEVKERIHRWITEDPRGSSADARSFANSLSPPSTSN